MSTPSERSNGGDDASAEFEEVDGLPVLDVEGAALRARRLVPDERRARALTSERRAPAAVAVQAAAAAAGGFVAGAAVIRLVDRRRRNGALAGRGGRRSAARRGRGGSERVEIVGSRSLLLDVHLLAGPGKGH
jgi:hypothetical protein